MCGIAGFIARHTLPASLIRDMTDQVRHRGPDDEGFWLLQDGGQSPLVCGGTDTPLALCNSALPYRPKRHIDTLDDRPFRIALGHRRLSIVDLSLAGHQPMCTRDRRYWIVYNGEIYNYRELRTELEVLGHLFYSQSDTEVVLTAYSEWGEDCLARFNGMFAFLLYDAVEDSLFAARDRFGVKPLYYWISPAGDIAFASEIKQFTVLPGWCPRVNGQRAYDFLAWAMTDHSEETLFKGVFQLRGGESLRLNLCRMAGEPALQLRQDRLLHKLWYALSPTLFSGTFHDAAAEFRERLTDAVRLRLRADVAVGSCLSGGLDSSSIVCIMNELLDESGASRQQKTFSACADVDRFDERKWIDTVVTATGVDAHYIYPALDGLFAESADITWYQDEPFGSTSIYAQWSVFRLAAQQGVKVMLDGQGADEQLAGYHLFFGPCLLQLLRTGQFKALLAELTAMKRLHGYSYSKLFEFMAYFALPENVKNLLVFASGRPSVVNPSWLDCKKLGCSPKNPHLGIGYSMAASIKELSIAQLTTSNLPMLLHWEDRDSMAHSIESRVPFLDYRLIEFVAGLPDRFKLSDGMTKRVMREGMTGIIPDMIRNRVDKLGFVTPEEVWLKSNAESFKCQLITSIERSGGIIRPSALGLFDDIVTARRPFSFVIWRLLNFGEWLSRFSVNVG